MANIFYETYIVLTIQTMTNNSKTHLTESDLYTCHCCLGHSQVLGFSGVDCAPQDSCTLLGNTGHTMLDRNQKYVYID